MHNYRKEVQQLLDVMGNSEQELTLGAKAIQLILQMAAKGSSAEVIEEKRASVTPEAKEDEEEGPQAQPEEELEASSKLVEKVEAESKPAVQEVEPVVDEPTEESKEKAKIDRTSQTLQALLSEKGDSQALDNWVQKDPKIFERLFDMVMVYKVSTRRIGFKAYNKNNKELRFRETIRNQFNPKNGDAILVSNAHTDSPRITKLIRRLAESYYPNTVTFDRGVVEVNTDKELIVKRNVSGKKLRVDGELFEYKIPAQAYNIHEGSIVRLRLYAQPRGERQNEDISLAWVYPERQEKVTTPAPKKEKGPKPQYQPTIKFDLAGKTVGIVVGRELYRDKYEAIIEAHNGKMLMVDAFYHRRAPENYFARRLSEADYVIMVQNQNKHNTSYALAKIKDQFQGFAVAKNLTGIQVEQAIYRAVKGLPAFVAG